MPAASPPALVWIARADGLGARIIAYRRLTECRWLDLARFPRGVYAMPLPVEVRLALLVQAAASAAVYAADLARTAGVPAGAVELLAPAGTPVRPLLAFGAELRRQAPDPSRAAGRATLRGARP